MIVKINKHFVKDCKRIDKYISNIIKHILDDINSAQNFEEISQKYDLKKMIWFDNFYRIRMWNYRLWFYYSGEYIEFVRILPRWEIYKYFP